MEELLERRKQVVKQISDAEGEKRMGELTDDQEMIKESQKIITSLNVVLNQIDAQIAEYQKEEQAKQAQLEMEDIFREQAKNKYPEQYEFFRIVSMSEEEIEALGNSNISDQAQRREDLEEEIIKLSNRTEELDKSLEEINRTIEMLKNNYKQTHNNAIFTEVTELTNKRKNIIGELEVLRWKSEEVNKKLSEATITSDDVEDYKKSKISKLEGKYVADIDTKGLDYVNKLRENDKSLAEVVTKINEEYNKNTELRKASQYSKTDKYKDCNKIAEVFPSYNETIETYSENSAMFTDEEISFSIALANNLEPMANNENLGPEMCGTINSLLEKISTTIPFAREYNAYKKAQESRPLLPQQDDYIKSSEKQLLNMKKELNDLVDTLNIQITAKIYADYLAATGDNKIQYDGQEMLKSILDFRVSEIGYLKAQEERAKALDTLNWIGITEEEKANAKATIERCNQIEEKYEHVKRTKRASMYATNGDRLTITLLIDASSRGINEDIENLVEEMEGRPGAYTENQLLRYIVHKKYLIDEKEKAFADSKRVKNGLLSKQEIKKRSDLENMFDEETILQAKTQIYPSR